MIFAYKWRLQVRPYFVIWINAYSCINYYLLTQYPFRSDYFFEDVFSDLWVYRTECIIQEEDIRIEINSSCQVDTLFLTSAQINTLDNTQLRD